MFSFFLSNANNEYGMKREGLGDGPKWFVNIYRIFNCCQQLYKDAQLRAVVEGPIFS